MLTGLIIGGIVGLVGYLVTLIIKRGQSRMKEQPRIMLDNVSDIQSLGLQRMNDRYSGIVDGYHTSVFATTDPQHRDRFQVLVATAPQPGQLSQMGGFFSNYFVSGEQPGFAYVGFRFNPNAANDPAQSLSALLKNLIGTLREQNVAAFKV